MKFSIILFGLMFSVNMFAQEFLKQFLLKGHESISRNKKKFREIENVLIDVNRICKIKNVPHIEVLKDVDNYVNYDSYQLKLEYSQRQYKKRIESIFTPSINCKAKFKLFISSDSKLYYEFLDRVNNKEDSIDSSMYDSGYFNYYRFTKSLDRECYLCPAGYDADSLTNIEIPYILSTDNEEFIFAVHEQVYYLKLIKHKVPNWRKKYDSEKELYDDFKNPIFYDIFTDHYNLHFIFEDKDGNLGVFR